MHPENVTVFDYHKYLTVCFLVTTVYVCEFGYRPIYGCFERTKTEPSSLILDQNRHSLPLKLKYLFVNLNLFL